MLKKSLEYEPSIEAQFEIATTYNSLNDIEQEKLWLEKVAAWPRSKSNAEYIRYAELRLISIQEEKFFKGDKLESVVVED